MIDFVETAREFCIFMETFAPKDYKIFLRKTHVHLINLYLHGQKLEEVELIYNAEFENNLTKTALKAIIEFNADRLNKNRYYFHVFNPTNGIDTGTVTGDLLDDLTDIYQELKSALLLYDIGKPPEVETALWSFKNSFDHHWSDHCMNAIYAIHYFIQQSN